MKNFRPLCAAVLVCFQISHAATLTVTTALDSGAGSLRQAILDANTNAAPDTINFSIGSGAQTITLISVLPTISTPVIIDGTTQPGFAGTPLVELNGALLIPGTNGLLITGGNSTVRGLVINRFSHGIILGGGTNVIAGNYIGTDVTGTLARGNTSRGIWITNSAGNLIGGTTASARNLISGNTFNGVEISGAGASNNLVQGNFIGTTASGTAALTNNGDGVLIQNSAGNNTIGGTNSGARNIISASGGPGVEISSAGANFVQGNYIGTDVNGAAALGNRLRGVRLISGGNTIGGTAAGARNIISGNSGNGVHFFNASSGSNSVQGNYIGTDVFGTNSLGNQGSGLLIENAANIIGGTAAGAGNVISGNQQHGIYLFGAASTGTTIRGNYVGTDGTGTRALGNFFRGIQIECSGITVGGGLLGATNIISANGDNGILLIGTNATACLVQGNFVGTQRDGVSALGNGASGILISGGASGNTIGGISSEFANRIAFNQDGVTVSDTNSVGNGVYGNSIFTNINLGINLEPTSDYTGIVTPNDAGDPDVGGNNLQNFPIITSVTLTGAVTYINGTLNSTPNRTFYIDFYRSSGADLSGYGEGEIYLGFDGISTDASGNATFSLSLGGSYGGQYFTATATDGVTSDTSEFSPAVSAAAGSFVFTTNNLSVAESAGVVSLTVNRVGGTYGAVSVQASPGNGTAVNGSDFNFAGATLNFTNGQTSGSFNIAIVEDTTDEPDEYFFLTLSNPTGGAAVGYPGGMTVTILDNDPVGISVSDAHVREGNSGNTDVVIYFTLSSATSSIVSVNFSTADGTANSSDHQSYSSLVTFAPGETNRAITLSGAVIGDTLQEPNETFFVNLSNPTNAVIVKGQGIVTIIDDDPLPSLSIANLTNNSVRLTWPTNAWGFLLESNANLSSLVWNTVSNPPVAVGTNFAVTNLMSSNSFYRLRFP